MVSPKRTHDSQELFDGVRSLHDPKSATLIAKLCAMGLSTPDSGAPPETRLRLRALVEQRQHEQRREEACFGRLEAIVARHWPELGRWVDVRTQRSALTLLTKYPSPARVVKAPDEARAVLRSASRMRLSEEALAGVVADASTTLGVPMVAEEEDFARTLATHLLEAGRSMDALEARMAEVAKDDEVFARLSTWMGVYTAAVIVTLVEPRQYASDETTALERWSRCRASKRWSGFRQINEDRCPRLDYDKCQTEHVYNCSIFLAIHRRRAPTTTRPPGGAATRRCVFPEPTIVMPDHSRTCCPAGVIAQRSPRHATQPRERSSSRISATSGSILNFATCGARASRVTAPSRIAASTVWRPSGGLIGNGSRVP
jgi:hypothetical protein